MENTPPKPKFLDLYTRHDFTPSTIDKDACVPSGTTDLMIQDFPVSEQYAKQILTVLNVFYREKYDLNTVKVKLLQENAPVR